MSAAQRAAACGKVRGPYAKRGNRPSTTKGYGKIKCEICGLPTRDHVGLGRCPFFEYDGGES